MGKYLKADRFTWWSFYFLEDDGAVDGSQLFKVQFPGGYHGPETVTSILPLRDSW